MNPSMRSKPQDKLKQALTAIVSKLSFRPSRTAVMSNGTLLFDDSGLIPEDDANGSGVGTGRNFDKRARYLQEFKAEIQGAANVAGIRGRVIEVKPTPYGRGQKARAFFQVDMNP
jgi:hypothetical protein